MKNYILLSIALFLGNASITHAQLPTIPQKVKENIMARIHNEITPSIVVGITSPQGISYFSYGVKSLENNELVDENSIFEIGSISKTFTGIILATMVKNREIALDDPLQKLLPEGINAPTKDGEQIKLFHLSNHTSGLPRLPDNLTSSNSSNPYADYTEEQMYDFLNGYELTRAVESEFEYSNYAVGLLGNVLAHKRNMSYEDLMLKTIAKPLQMENTAIVFTPKMKENLAFGHSTGLQVENWDLPTLAGAGAIRSSAADMIKYISANMGLVESNLYPAMQLSHQVSSHENIHPKVGLGWIIDQQDSVEYIWHNGATGGYRAFSGFIKDGSLGVVVLTNSDAAITDIGMHLLDPSKPLGNPKPSIAIKIKPILDYKGIRKASKVYWKIKKNNKGAYDFTEENLNALGYSYIQKGELEKAISVFKLNLKAFPESSNAFDSYAEGLMLNKQDKRAIKHYKKSLALNPGNTNAIQMLKKLGIKTEGLTKKVTVDEHTLEAYVGDYELAPGFILTITKVGEQLMAQATGQGANPIYPKSRNEFYLKVVEAQVVFNWNDKNEVESLTLFQAGQEIVGKKK